MTSGNPIRSWIEDQAARHGGDVYLADARGPATLTYAELLATVQETERRLDEAGLPLGARITVRLASPFSYATALAAIIAAGRVAVPLDPGAPDEDIARVNRVAQPAGSVTEAARTVSRTRRPAAVTCRMAGRRDSPALALKRTVDWLADSEYAWREQVRSEQGAAQR